MATKAKFPLVAVSHGYQGKIPLGSRELRLPRQHFQLVAVTPGDQCADIFRNLPKKMSFGSRDSLLPKQNFPLVAMTHAYQGKISQLVAMTHGYQPKILVGSCDSQTSIQFFGLNYEFGKKFMIVF